MGANGGGSRSASREFGTEISRPDGRFWRVIPGPRQLPRAIFWGLGPADRGQLCPAPPARPPHPGGRPPQPRDCARSHHNAATRLTLLLKTGRVSVSEP